MHHRPRASPVRRLLVVAPMLSVLAPAPAWGAPPAAPAPPLKLPGIDGKMHDLAELARTHRALVINFWATWCGPCIIELPEFDAVFKKFKGEGLAMVGINLGEKADKAVAFAKQIGVSFPMLLDPEGAAREAYAVFAGLPVTAIVDRKGLVRHRIAGAMSGEGLRAKLEPMLREP